MWAEITSLILKFDLFLMREFLVLEWSCYEDSFLMQMEKETVKQIPLRFGKFFYVMRMLQGDSMYILIWEEWTVLGVFFLSKKIKRR